MGASTHLPSAYVNVSVRFLLLRTEWSVSSSLTAPAVQATGVQDDRNAHQIVAIPLRFGGVALPVTVTVSRAGVGVVLIGVQPANAIAAGESPIPRPPGFRAGLFNLSSVDHAVHGVGVPARRSVLGRVR
jgi:hypothetical protein